MELAGALRTCLGLIMYLPLPFDNGLPVKLPIIFESSFFFSSERVDVLGKASLTKEREMICSLALLPPHTCPDWFCHMPGHLMSMQMSSYFPMNGKSVVDGA